MYDPSIISEHLSTVDPIVIINQGTPDEKSVRFEISYKSRDERIQAFDHFNNLINYSLYEQTNENHKEKVRIEYKNPKYKFSEEELIWMRNEQLISKFDYNYWAEANYQILNHENVWIHFVPNTSQRINNRIFARREKARLAIRKFVLKARQGGETTDSQGRILHRINYYPDAKGLISSKDQKSTTIMSQMFTNAQNKLPFWNRAFRTRFQTGDFYEFDIDSLLDLGYGTQDSIGRGRTPTLYHGSEIPFYKYPQEALEEALFKAMHESKWMLQILEGTAEVRGDWFHKKWLEYSKGMERGTTSVVTVFHPWVYRTDIYPTEAWLRARSDYYAKWIPKTETIQLAKKIERWIYTNPDARAELGENYQVPLEQLFFYEIEKEAAENNNQLHKFLKEMPSTPDEAFQHAGHSVYPVKLILSMSTEAQQINPDVYMLKGDVNEINPTLFPTEDQIDYSKDFINIKAKWAPNLPAFEYQMVPIKFEGWDRFNPINKILIWEHPVNNANYGCAVDPSEGLGINISDDAVIEIIKKGTVYYKDKQVCEFGSPELPPDMLWPFILALATYYSPQEQLLYAPEINKNGDAVLSALANRGWYNIYKMIDQSKLGQDISSIRKFGWETNNRTRTEIINTMNSFIMGQWVDIFSVPLLDEIKDIEKKDSVTATLGMKKSKISGKVDNRFMATGICLCAIHRDEFLGMQTKAWEERIRNENSSATFATFKEPSFDIVDESMLGYYSQDRYGSEDNPMYYED